MKPKVGNPCVLFLRSEVISASPSPFLSPRPPPLFQNRGKGTNRRRRERGERPTSAHSPVAAATCYCYCTRISAEEQQQRRSNNQVAETKQVGWIRGGMNGGGEGDIPPWIKELRKSSSSDDRDVVVHSCNPREKVFGKRLDVYHTTAMHKVGN